MVVKTYDYYPDKIDKITNEIGVLRKLIDEKEFEKSKLLKLWDTELDERNSIKRI